MIKRLVLILFFTTFIGIVSAGCARQGIYFDIDQADNLVPGVTTEEDAISLFGEPVYRGKFPDGSYLLRWSFDKGILLLDSSYLLELLFDQQGYFIEIAYKYKPNYWSAPSSSSFNIFPSSFSIFDIHP